MRLLFVFVLIFGLFSCRVKQYHISQIEYQEGWMNYKVLKSNGKKISGVVFDKYDNGQLKFQVICKKA